MTLPNQPNLHLFALSVAEAATTGGASAVNLQPLYNNAGTTSDGTVTAGNFDGGGYSYSAQALRRAGISRGGVVVANGVTFQWPGTSAGAADNVVAQGQTVAFSATQAGTFDGDMYRQTSPASRTLYYVSDPGGRLLALTDGATVYYYGLDGHSSVANLTDSNGNVVNTYRYDPYGNSLGKTEGAALPNPWQYAGGYLDAESGLYLLGARYYAPTLGRFLQPDPLGSTVIRPYSYIDSDPCNNGDLTGFTTCYHYVSGPQVSAAMTKINNDMLALAIIGATETVGIEVFGVVTGNPVAGITGPVVDAEYAIAIAVLSHKYNILSQGKNGTSYATIGVEVRYDTDKSYNHEPCPQGDGRNPEFSVGGLMQEVFQLLFPLISCVSVGGSARPVARSS